MEVIQSREEILVELYNRELRFNRGRLSRALLAPFKNCLFVLARILRLKIPVTVKLQSGYKFQGFITEAVSSVIWRYGFFDIGSTISFIREIPKGGVVIDVGAHFGYFSMLAARCVGPSGKVISIEAMPSTFDCLKKNIVDNGLQDVCELVNSAASNNDNGSLGFTDYGIELSSLNSAFGSRNPKLTSGVVAEKIEVKTLTIDGLVKSRGLDRVDFVKVDAESSEYIVLEGMREVLTSFKPIVIVELGDNDVVGAERKTIEVIELVESCGYKAMFRDGKDVRELPKKELYDYCNVLFYPEA